MDLMGFLSRAIQEVGLPGHEGQVSRLIGEAFKEYTNRVETDGLYNLTALMGDEGPRFFVTAHQDEIGLVVLTIEEDGCLRFARMGGVDMRILPASTVTVHARGGDLFGVVGAKPAHLLDEKYRDQALRVEDLFIDLGMDGEKAKQLVRPGDLITLTGPLVKLQDGRWAGKTLDDRACVAAMLEAAKWLSRMKAPAQVCFASASQEEVGSRGAQVSCWAQDPDVAIAIDVTHAPTPGTDKWETYPLDKLTITVGPNIHPVLAKKLQQVAKDNGVPFTVEPCGHITWTDAEVTQVTRGGVPTVLIGVPLRYMHTTVEMVDEKVLADTGRLVALFIDELARGWEEIKWY